MNERFDKLPENKYLSELDLRTLGEDVRYREEIEERHPTIFFRPGDRTSASHPRYFPDNEPTCIGFITHYGSHIRAEPPTFLEQRIPVQLVSREAKRISELTSAECAQAYEELQDPSAVLHWLQEKYPDDHLTPDSLITVYRIEYLPDTDANAAEK